MMQGEAISSIAIIGSGVRAWFVAACLAARFPAGTCRICVVPDGADDDTGEIFARPTIRRVHQLLQITEQELAGLAGAQPSLFAERVKADGKRVRLPFGVYGVDRGGADFFQYWVRAASLGQVSDLSAYNLALEMARAGVFVSSAPSGLPVFDYGYRFSRAGYGKLMRKWAEAAGVTVAGSAAPSDLVVRLGGHRSEPRMSGWYDGGLFVGRRSCVPGLELHVLQTAVERLIALLPDRRFLACETREYDRLARAEHERIQDMVDLLDDGATGESQSDALKRKLSVFARRGRVPREDFEVFTGPEWLAALVDAGLRPVEYDRLADKIDARELMTWLAGVETAIAQTIDKLASAGKVA